MQDIISERYVLASILQKNETYYDVADILTTSCFTDSLNQIIFKCAERLFKTEAKIDQTLIVSAGYDLGFKNLEDSVNAKYIRALFNFPTESENVVQLAQRLRTLDIRRHLVSLTNDIKNSLVSADKEISIDDTLNLVEKPLFDFTLSLNKSEELSSIGDGLLDWVQYKLDNPSEKVGISTGLDRFDEAIGGGPRRKSLTVIGARSKTGKTVVADYFALKIGGAQSINTLMLDTEMDKADHWARQIASMTQIPLTLIENGKFTEPENLRKVKIAAEKISKAPIHYQSVAGRDISQIISIMRKWVKKTVGFDDNGRTKDCIIIYDYLKLMSSDELASLQEFQAIGFAMTQLHNFAHKYDVPIIVFVQLNRDGIEKENEATVSQSDRIIWLSSSFSILKNKTAEEIAEDGPDGGNKKLITVLARHGPGSRGNYINLHFDGDCTRLTPAKTQREIHDDKLQIKEEIPFG